MASNKLDFYREDGERIWWVDDTTQKGELLFSFDREKIYNFWKDYPDKLTPEEREIFDRENPVLAGLK